MARVALLSSLSFPSHVHFPSTRHRNTGASCVEWPTSCLVRKISCSFYRQPLSGTPGRDTCRAISGLESGQILTLFLPHPSCIDTLVAQYYNSTRLRFRCAQAYDPCQFLDSYSYPGCQEGCQLTAQRPRRRHYSRCGR